MLLTANDIARMIDISAVRTPHGDKEIINLVKHAKEYSFKAVHVLPCWVTFLKQQLTGTTNILIGAPVGFPSGAHKTVIKIMEAKELLKDGVQEMDMMLNVGKLRSRAYQYVEDEIRAIVDVAGGEGVLVKVILEVHFLTNEEIKKACELCINANAEFVKTSTGWAPSGATLETVSLITKFVGNSVKVKAAGNIRNLDILIKMYKMGVVRFGINVDASMEIIKECSALPGGFLEL